MHQWLNELTQKGHVKSFTSDFSVKDSVIPSILTQTEFSRLPNQMSTVCVQNPVTMFCQQFEGIQNAELQEKGKAMQTIIKVYKVMVLYI